jgi:hypothetical protein
LPEKNREGEEKREEGKEHKKPKGSEEESRQKKE